MQDINRIHVSIKAMDDNGSVTVTRIDAVSNPQEPLGEFLRRIGATGNIDFEVYYRMGASDQASARIPWVIADERLVIDADYDSVTVDDFLRSFQTEENTIHLTTNYTAAGGAELIAAGAVVLFVLNALSSIEGTAQLGKRLKSVWAKLRGAGDGETALRYFDLVLSRDCWSHVELATLLEISAADAIAILTVLEYKFDSKQLLYKKTLASGLMQQKLQNIDLVKKPD